MLADRARRAGGLRGGMFLNLDGGRGSGISSFNLSGVIHWPYTCGANLLYAIGMVWKRQGELGSEC